MATFLSYDKLLYYHDKLKTFLSSTYQAQESGKGLSTNDFTTPLYDKLDGIEDNANNYTLPTMSATVIGGAKVGAGLTITDGVLSTTGGGEADSVEWDNILNKPTIPTKVSELENDSKFQTEAEVAASIAEAAFLKIEIVSTLPDASEAESNTIYLVPASGSTSESDIYDEYVVIDGVWERIGSTAIDVTLFWQKDDLVEVTNAQVDALFAS